MNLDSHLFIFIMGFVRVGIYVHMNLATRSRERKPLVERNSGQVSPCTYHFLLLSTNIVLFTPEVTLYFYPNLCFITHKSITTSFNISCIQPGL
jgi:hypothetical protein